MTKRILLGATALQTFAAGGLAFIATPALAQDAPSPTTEQEAAAGAPAVAEDSANQGDDAIVVTGSRIRRPNLESPLPVTSISGEEFFETGNVSVGDTLNDLPALRSTFSQSNSTRFLGTAGLNLLDLRGLGAARTLVLQNGRRHVGGDVLASGVTPDVNTIPTDLIERVDVVTGGNSAVYGSDAISGVVNFILKDDYEGLQLRAQGGASKYEDAGAYFISGLWGTNFADGRGNVAINAEYARQQQYFGSNRPHIAQNNGFLVVDTDPSGSDGNPDRLFFHDIRNASLSNSGTVRFGGGTLADGVTPSPLNCGIDPTGNPLTGYTCNFIFQSDGTLVPQTGTRVAVGPVGSFIGGNGDNFRSGDQFQLSPQLDRYNVNLIAHYEISPALIPFVEAKYSRTDSVGTGNSGPAFVQGATLGDPAAFVFGGGNRETFRLDNPFLNPQARDLICDQRALNGQGCTDATRIAIRENLLGLGARTEEAKRETYRIVGGFRGTFNDDWSYEVSANYGKLNEKTKVKGNLDIQRWLLGMDAVDEGVFNGGPANGNIVCRSQLQDPVDVIGYYPWVYGVAFPGGANAGDPNGAARLAADVAACVPINPFGGNFSQEVRDYVLLDSTTKGESSQLDFLAFISGDTSGFLNLPGGPVSFVLGAEYRQDDLSYQLGGDVELGYTFYNAIPTFGAPKSKVKEAFGEVRIPIVKDVPFFHELELSGAARVSDYNLGTTGTVWAYNASGIWSPIDGLRLRGNYGRSVRAPNQVELFAPPGQNFAPAFNDPCSARNIGTGSQNRAANCAATGIPVSYDFNYSSSLELVSGGNTNLAAETADSYTLGFVATPAFLPGFSASVDWYKITVNDVITSPTPQAIVNACYDLPSLDNQFCSLFERVPGGGTGPRGEEEFRIVEGSLFQQPLNYAKLRAEGIDVEVAYRGEIGNIGKLDTRFTYTHVLDRSDFLDPTNPDFKNVIVGKHGGELGDPEDSFNWNTSLKRGILTVGYQMRFLSSMYVNTYEDFNGVQGRDPENEDFAEIKKFPSRWYHDVRASVDITKDYNFYLGIDNLTNTKPPLGLTGIGGGSSIYDVRGRFYYAGVTAKF